MASTISATQKPQELKLGQPPSFDGTPEKARGWFNNVQLYLLVNKDIYNNDDRKIAYALSFMREGSAALWSLTETEAALKRNPPNFGTWQNFLNKFSTSFILENTKDQAIAWMTTTRVDKKTPLMDYISQFKNNAALSKISNGDVLINFYSRGIPSFLMRKIYGMDTVPNTIDKWYQATLRFQHVQEKTNEIARGKMNPSTRTTTETTITRKKTQTPSDYQTKNTKDESKKDFASHAGKPDTFPTHAETPSPRRKKRNPKTRNQRYPPR